MKKRCLLIFLLTVLSLACFAACNVTGNYDGQVKIIFELEGGVYNNCTLPVIHYYNLAEGQTSKISEMTALYKGKLTRTGYELEGWYKQKNGDGSYSDKWDFDSDTVTAGQELTLYANWETPIKYTYDICYIDEETHEKVVLNSMATQAGASCSLIRVEQRAKRDGYTVVDYFDADGNLWDESFTHPGGESDLAVEIYVKYVKGDYTVVKSASDFGGENVYLARDIDMKGAKLNLSFFTKGIFEGNGHTVSNFVIDYTVSRYDLIPDYDDNELDCLSIGIFGNLNGATVRNVTFDNYSVNVEASYSEIDKIYVSPLCGSITNSTLNNVKATNFAFTYNEKKLPSGFFKDGQLQEGKLVLVKDRFAYAIDAATQITGCTVAEHAPAAE